MQRDSLPYSHKDTTYFGHTPDLIPRLESLPLQLFQHLLYNYIDICYAHHGTQDRDPKAQGFGPVRC